MPISKPLIERCKNACELCTNTYNDLIAYAVPLRTDGDDAHSVVLCPQCHDHISHQSYENEAYFRFLTTSIWSEVSAVKVLSYKLLQQLQSHTWAQDVLESAYLDEDELKWANEESEALAGQVIHKDAYGVVLQQGDTVFLTENLNVKGANFIAPKGTKVVKIRLVADNAEQIEGKIEGSTIVLLTKYVRKSH